MTHPFKQPPRELDRDAFVDRFGGVYEHAPWIAEMVFEAGLMPRHDSPSGLHEAMKKIVEAAPRDRQLALLRAHPDLGGRLATAGETSRQSASEQSGAGLDQCTPEEFARFAALNKAYNAKFGFPFLVAVKGKSRGEILAAFEARSNNDGESEFRTALDEVHKIALFRLRDL
ncbi:MAG: 2-oxo-4-hydroxy-4-carboxy-5-ureidoimidazoline decarboxylase [Pseudolabrys sp.]